MKNLSLLILIFPSLVFADFKRLSFFGFQPSPADENRVQIVGWDKINSSVGSSYGAYVRTSELASARDGMSIYTWDTKSETSLSLKTVIVSTYFTSTAEKDKNLREVYIYDYDRNFELEAVTYCQPNIKSCTSIKPEFCQQNKPISTELVERHTRTLSSHYLGIDSSFPSDVADKMKSPDPILGKKVCDRFFKVSRPASAKKTKSKSGKR